MKGAKDEMRNYVKRAGNLVTLGSSELNLVATLPRNQTLSGLMIDHSHLFIHEFFT